MQLAKLPSSDKIERILVSFVKLMHAHLNSDKAAECTV